MERTENRMDERDVRYSTNITARVRKCSTAVARLPYETYPSNDLLAQITFFWKNIAISSDIPYYYRRILESNYLKSQLFHSELWDMLDVAFFSTGRIFEKRDKFGLFYLQSTKFNKETCKMRVEKYQLKFNNECAFKITLDTSDKLPYYQYKETVYEKIESFIDAVMADYNLSMPEFDLQDE